MFENILQRKPSLRAMVVRLQPGELLHLHPAGLAVKWLLQQPVGVPQGPRFGVGSEDSMLHVIIMRIATPLT